MVIERLISVPSLAINKVMRLPKAYETIYVDEFREINLFKMIKYEIIIYCIYTKHNAEHYEVSATKLST